MSSWTALASENGRDRDQQVGVIRRASSSKQHDLVVSRDHGEITRERLGIVNHVDALFSTECAVHQDGGVGVGHGLTVA